MRADNKKVVDPAARGRQSVRIKSNKAYLEHAVVSHLYAVFGNIPHAPKGIGCSSHAARLFNVRSDIISCAVQSMNCA